MRYYKEDIEERCKEAIKDPRSFYKFRKDGRNSCLVNYRSKTIDSSEYCTEVIVEFLLKEENLRRLKGITENKRTKNKDSYNMHHKGKFLDKNGKELKTEEVDHTKEKIIAIDLFNQCNKDGKFEHLGKIIDYQTPLKAQKSDPYGEIDLLAVNEEKKEIYILELKKHNAKTPETMLRCLLEAFTYYKLVDKKEMLKNFDLQDYDVKDIVISPLVFKDDVQYKEWMENKKIRESLDKLIKKLDVKVEPFFLEPCGKYKYKISKE